MHSKEKYIIIFEKLKREVKQARDIKKQKDKIIMKHLKKKRF